MTTSDGARLNFYCMGTGSPAVIFEAAYADWSPVWSVVQPRVAQWTRACSYDRAGYGFSGPGPKPRKVQTVTEELHDALHKLNIAGPYILVSHATGTNTIRAFADNYLDEVAGLVLIDADIRDLESEADLRKIWIDLDARNLAELHMCRDGVAAGKKPPLTPPADHPGWTCDDFLLRGLPDKDFSPELNAALLQTATKLEVYDTLISEKAVRLEDGDFLKAHATMLGARPIRVVTTGSQFQITPTMTPDQSAWRAKLNTSNVFYHKKLLGLSSNSREITSGGTSAYVQLDAPDVVVGAIRKVYDQRVR